MNPQTKPSKDRSRSLSTAHESGPHVTLLPEDRKRLETLRQAIGVRTAGREGIKGAPSLQAQARAFDAEVRALLRAHGIGDSFEVLVAGEVAWGRIEGGLNGN